VARRQLDFVVWGGFHGTLLAIERAVRGDKSR